MGLPNKSIKLLIGIFIFFLISYLFFDLFFNLSGGLELYIKSLSANIVTASIIILLLIADILLPVPSSIVIVASGALFGGFLGGLITLIGSLAGSIINFQISRKFGQVKVRSWMKEKEYDDLSISMRMYGAYIVIFTRMIPLVMESVSSVAGISNMRLKKFIVMNIVGFLPITFLYSYTGAIFKQHPQSLVVVLALGFFVPLILWYLLLKTRIIKNTK